MATKTKDRVTASGMRVHIDGRGRALGLKGTFENIAHHGEGCRYAVSVLSAAAEHFPFKWWIQAHNVHTFVTHDGREYRFRPLHVGSGTEENDPKGYVGLELFQKTKTGKVVIMQIISAEDVALCIQLMHHFAQPRHTNYHHPARAEAVA